jgi:cyclase
MVDRNTRIIPGHGPVSNDGELRAWRSMLSDILENVRKSAGNGKSLAEVKQERPTKKWDGSVPKSFVTSDHVVEEAYRSVTSKP